MARVALDQLESNLPGLLNDLNNILSCKNCNLVNYVIESRSNLDMMSSQFSNVTTYMGAPETELILEFSVSHKAKLEYVDIFSKFEDNIAELLSHSIGYIMSKEARQTSPVTMYVIYRCKITSYEDFLSSVARLARSKVDREFTKALEAKLSED